MNRRIRILRAIRAGVFGQAVQTLLQLISVPLYVSHWGTERYGLWLMISTIPAYLLASDFGIGRTATSEVTMRFARGDMQGARNVYETTLICMITLVSAMIFIALLSIWISPEFVFARIEGTDTLSQRVTLTCMVLYGAIILCGSLLSPGFQATGNYAREVWLASSLWLIEGMITIINLVTGGNMLRVAVSLLLCRMFGFIAQAMAMRRTASWLVFSFQNAQLEIVKTLWRSSVANMTIPAANALLLQGTALAVGWGASTAAVPVFAVSRTLTRFALQLSNGVTRSTAPEFAKAFAINDIPAQRKLMFGTVAIGLGIGFIFAGGFSAFGIYVIEIWTNHKVIPSEAMIYALAISLLLSSTWLPVTMLMVSTNKQAIFAPQLLTSSILAVAITYFLSMKWGALGGAVGMILVDLAMICSSIRVIGQLFGSLRQFLNYSLQKMSHIFGKA